jgi:DNA-binding protein HU-beta
MNKAELCESIATTLTMNKKDVENVLDAFEQTVMTKLKAHEEVTLTGFGTFSAKDRSSRMGVNPQNPTERIQIPAVTIPKFKAGKALKDSLKHTASHTPASTPPPATPAE